MRQPMRQPRAHLHIANNEPHPAMQQHHCQNREPAQQVHCLKTRRRRPLYVSSVGLHSFYSNITVTFRPEPSVGWQLSEIASFLESRVFGNLELGVLMCWIRLYELVAKGEPSSKSVPQRLKLQRKDNLRGQGAFCGVPFPSTRV